MSVPVNFKKFVTEVQGVDIISGSPGAGQAVAADEETQDYNTRLDLFGRVDKLGQTMVFWAEDPGRLMAKNYHTGDGPGFKGDPKPKAQKRFL